MNRNLVLFGVVMVGVVEGAGVLLILVTSGSTPNDVLITRIGLLTGTLAPTGAALLAILQGARNQDAIVHQTEKLNGHVQKHVGHTDEEIQQMIDAALERRQQPPPAPPPILPPGGGGGAPP